jgi:hypothetical protein
MRITLRYSVLCLLLTAQFFSITQGVKAQVCISSNTIQIVVNGNGSGTFSRFAPACVTGAPQNNGSITLAALTNSDRYGISTLNAATYNGPAYASAATAVPALLTATVPNAGGTYIIRLYGASATCFRDTTISMAPTFCPPPCANPLIATPCYVFGQYQGNATDAFVSFAVFPDKPPAQNSFNMNNVTHLALHNQVGCVYGTAYNLASNQIYASAYIKRHSGLGPGGTGAIYRIDPLNITPPSVFVDLNALFGANTAGVNPHPYTSTDVCPASGGGSSNFACWYNDVNSWDAVGRQGLGDIDISPDGNYLYAMNMTNKSIYRIPTNSPNASNISIYPFPTSLPGAISPCGPATQVRPMGVGVRGNQVYVAAICSEEVTKPSGGTWGGSMVYIYALDPTTGTWTKALEGDIMRNSVARCFSWPATFTGTYADGLNMIVSDMDFDQTGQMILGIRDISGDRYGSETGKPIPADGSSNWYSSSGDILKACYNSTTGLYELEQNGVCGGTTSTGTASGQGIPSTLANAREYYHGDYMITGPTSINEIALGGVAYDAGTNTVFSTAFDVLGVFEQGVISLNNATGARDASYTLLTNTNNVTAFGKTNGFGDLEMVNCCVIDVEARDSAVCSGIAVNLNILTENPDNAFGQVTYHPTLNDAINFANVIAAPTVSPATTTKYYIRKQFIPSCFDLDSIIVTVYQPITVGITAPNGTVCTNGTMVLNANVTNLTADCTIYWQQQVGALWQDIAGATGVTYTTSALSVATSYRARIDCINNQCADECASP